MRSGDKPGLSPPGLRPNFALAMVLADAFLEVV